MCRDNIEKNKDKVFKKYVFSDGYFCYVLGMSYEEKQIMEFSHGKLLRIEVE